MVAAAAGGADSRAEEGENIIKGIGALGTDMVVINEAIFGCLVDCFF